MSIFGDPGRRFEAYGYLGIPRLGSFIHVGYSFRSKTSGRSPLLDAHMSPLTALLAALLHCKKFDDRIEFLHFNRLELCFSIHLKKSITLPKEDLQVNKD